jgi:putative transposase
MAHQTIRKLREAEVDLARGHSVLQVCKKLEICERIYYRWGKEYSGLRLDQAKRLNELEKKNSQLKKLVTEQALEISILKDDLLQLLYHFKS